MFVTLAYVPQIVGLYLSIHNFDFVLGSVVNGIVSELLQVHSNPTFLITLAIDDRLHVKQARPELSLAAFEEIVHHTWRHQLPRIVTVACEHNTLVFQCLLVANLKCHAPRRLLCTAAVNLPVVVDKAFVEEVLDLVEIKLLLVADKLELLLFLSHLSRYLLFAEHVMR